MVLPCKKKEPCQNQFSILLLRILHRSLNNSAEFAILFFCAFSALDSSHFFLFSFTLSLSYSPCVCVSLFHLFFSFIFPFHLINNPVEHIHTHTLTVWIHGNMVGRVRETNENGKHFLKIVARRKYATRNEILNLSLEITSNSVENVKSC